MFDPNWIVAVATVAYVMLTMVICASNASTARAARKQTEELILQRELMSRPIIQVSFEVTARGLLCFRIGNVGKQASYSTHISLNAEFIERMDASRQELARELNDAVLFIVPGQELFLNIGTRAQFDVLSKSPALFRISYCDGKYQEEITIDISQYGFSLLVDDPIDEISKSLKSHNEQSKKQNDALIKAIKQGNKNDVVVVREETEHDCNKETVLKEILIHSHITLDQLVNALDLPKNEIISCLQELSLRDNLVQSFLGTNYEEPSGDSSWFKV